MEPIVINPIVFGMKTGKANAISRKELSNALCLPDRTVRALIEDARAAGVLICNDQDGRGYYLAETKDEIERQFRRDKARAMSLLVRMKPFREALTVMEGQLGIDQN